MVMKIANRNNGDAGVLMKPEGAVKVVVLNGSRQIDQVVAGAGNNGEAGWVTQKSCQRMVCPRASTSSMTLPTRQRTSIRRASAARCCT